MRLKRVLSVFVTAAMIITSVAIPTVFANNSADTAEEYISKYNCLVLNTEYYSGGERIFGADAPSVSATTVKNYTASDNVGVTATVYAVVNGAKKEIAKSTQNLNSLDEKKISVNFNTEENADEYITVITSTLDIKEYNTASIPAGKIIAPKVTPPDSDTTTNGAHDPSIVKFDGDDTYYVYSSHHLLFTSTDLINWTKYDFTNKLASEIAPKTCKFVTDNIDNNVNGTYWAPDVIYMPNDTEHPYWMYISVSCGLGGRNSAIGLIKSPTPLFWADPDREKVSAIEDAGVVFATKETSAYKTNAIDANIYTDTDGGRYFIWGSFWGGIQMAPLTSDGRVEGIDYTSDSAILNSCRNFGTSIFTQKRGVAGPEGAWLFNHGGYRYAFTSYAWLGSNYNTRVSRSSLSEPFSASTLYDANNVDMGKEYSRSTGAVKASEITGYKLAGSFRLGDGTTTMSEDSNTNSWYYAREAGDAHIYYGLGHNSVIETDDGEVLYCSHVRKDAVEGGAVLQIRKMLFTEDGWPVINPIAYSGEKEQTLPISLITGTYDLASVGVTKLDGTDTINENWTKHSGNRNYDLPVISSKVTLNNDNTMTKPDGSKIGIWSFDNNYTVTLKFTSDGDSAKDEFYNSGDTMTMFALLSYDKDEAEYVISFTGTNQKHITQFAKKSLSQTYCTEPQKITSEAKSITKSDGGNPELGFDGDGNTMYGGDPAALVDGDTVYLYVGHDTASGDGYYMPDWACYSSKNMTDWKYEGIVMSDKDISWRNVDAAAWASQTVKYNGTYYFYFCTWDKDASGQMSIGVATSDKPTGPFKDSGAALVKGTFTTPMSNSHDDIDPTVWIDTDDEGAEHRYIAWGNTRLYVAELNEDMTSIRDLDGDGKIVMHKDIAERKIKSMTGTYTEAPWLYRRTDENGKHYGKYYLFYAMNWREEMAYAMADDPFGRWDYKQTIMPPTATSNTNHPSVIDFNGKTYFIYHNGMLPHGSGFRRSVCIEELEFDEDGYVYPLTETSVGLAGMASTILSASDRYVSHDEFRNPLTDASYPLNTAVTAKASADGLNSAWEIMSAKYVPDGENKDNYVSIQSVNKPGLYISEKDGEITLTQDADGNQGRHMTFKTVNALNGDGNAVSFESIAEEGRYLSVINNKLSLSYGTNTSAASFIISALDIDTIPKNKIDVAEVEPEPDPAAGIENNFDNESIGTVMSVVGSDQGANVDYAGVELYIGQRDGGASGTNWAIENSGRTGNALVMNSGRFVSANRGPRMKLTDAAIPDGYTMTGSVYIKLGSSASQLFYGDSTSVQGAENLTDKLSQTDWAKAEVTIENSGETYIRTIKVNDEVIATDYVGSFPVFWGTAANDTYSKVYFDDVSIKTETSDGSIPPMKAKIEDLYISDGKVNFNLNKAAQYGSVSVIVAEYDGAVFAKAKVYNIDDVSDSEKVSLDYERLSDDNSLKVYVWYGDMIPAAAAQEIVNTSKPLPYTAYYSFDGDLKDAVTGNEAKTIGWDSSLAAGQRITAAKSAEAAYSDGYKGKAATFSGNNSDGVNLGKAITDSKYSVSFWIKANAITQFTAALFIDVDGGSRWVSAPIGWQSGGTLMVWSNDGNYIDMVSSFTAETGKWYQITITADGQEGVMYVNGNKAASGNIANVITSDTDTILGMNYWDTPFDGLIDEVYIYNGKTLSASEVMEYYTEQK